MTLWMALRIKSPATPLVFACCTLLAFSLQFSVSAQAKEAKPDLNWAMAYETPEHKCVRPKLAKTSGAAGRFDRFERKMKRFGRCIQKYQQTLVKDHEQIVASAGTATSKEQLPVLAGKLKGIEAAIVSARETVNYDKEALEFEAASQSSNRPSI